MQSSCAHFCIKNLCRNPCNKNTHVPHKQTAAHGHSSRHAQLASKWTEVGILEQKILWDLWAMGSKKNQHERLQSELSEGGWRGKQLKLRPSSFLI